MEQALTQRAYGAFLNINTVESGCCVNTDAPGVAVI